MSPFPYIKDHALIRRATRIEEVDKLLRQRISPRTLDRIVDLIPDEWLEWEGVQETPSQLRDVYERFLTTRLKNSYIFVKEASDARKSLV